MMAVNCTLQILLLLLFILLSPVAITAGATDTFGKGQNVTDGETLVSAGGTFTLGFFSPGASAKRYLGIWFSVSSDAVCWVANRDHPLKDTSGVLLVASDTGDLLLLDGSGEVAWSSNSPNTSSVEAQLLESGNLVVHDQRSKTILWQSFDHPSNTLLPGMKMGKNLWTGDEWYLTSWRSPDDPSPGSYRRVLEYATRLPEVVLWQQDAKAYRTGPWNGRWFNGVPEASTYAHDFPLDVTASKSEITYGYTARPGAPLSRVVVTDAGMVRRLVWDASSLAWKTFFQGPRDVCDAYGKCGAFGLCDASAASSAFCGCLQGFNPASPPAWYMREASGGCRRNVPLNCGGNETATDGFVLVRGVKLPDTQNASVDMSISMEECRDRCFANCSCLAYASAEIREGGGGSGCIIWTGDLVDLRYVDRGQDLYLRLAGPEIAVPKGSKFAIATVLAPVASAVAIILVLLFVICWRRKHRISRKRLNDGIPQSSAMTVPSVDLHTLKEATLNFSESHVIGEGGFGIVYKGQLPDGRTIAVKRLRQCALTRKGKCDFAREVEVMARLRHGNLIRLLAYCDEGEERILVYVYMPNKSLDLYIFGEPSLRATLSWRQRLDIINGIAQGVAYMHEGSGESVVHRDLKLQNVLLDDNWRAKVADFGTAKLFVAERVDSSLTIVNSPGYASPESLRAEMTLKCDVYSFGVVLLEILSGQRNGETQRLLLHAWGLWEQDRKMALLDPTVNLPPLSRPDSDVGSELERCIQIGLLCIQESPDDRPAMSDVVAVLTTKTSQIARPNRPGIYNQRTRFVTGQADLTRTTTIDLE
ncbi:receptor-like serine/threonine-protein kinase SD1-8 [Triticum dicoccoides]|uniref:receptor-like serine/threonine-protein kinase SD1-8 n=1 Tax=Triticum dicoccoides TaxID=85692 RepID=UPI00188EFC15|nr:receptor-like serine/threonine-protein kinase SD1-8 [Triticum dicoccoides]